MKMVKHLRGVETRGCQLDFGDFGLKAEESGWMTSRHIEAGRVAMTRHAKRGGKVWIRVFPHKPRTSKPAETRMGKGKGSPEDWVAEVREGRILYEITGVEKTTARRALELAAAKMPFKCTIVERTDTLL